MTRSAILARVVAVVLATAAAVSAPACRRARRPPTAPAATVLGPFQVGREVSAKLALRLRLALGDRGAQEMKVAARWRSVPVEIEGGVAEIACRLSDVSVTLAADRGGDAEGRRGAERELAGALAKPFYVAVGADGALAGFWFPSGTNPAVENVLVTAAAAQQLVRRSRPTGAASGAQAWVVEERDGSGAYLAAYRETSAGHVEKKKARYLDGPTEGAIATEHPGRAAPKAPLPRPRIEKADTSFVTDAAGRVLEVDAHETLLVALGRGVPTLETTVDLALTGATTGDAPSAPGAFSRERARLDWRSIEQASNEGGAQQLARDRAVLAGAGLDELRATLHALPSGEAVKGDAPARSMLERRFEALFRLRPEAAGQAPEAARAESAPRAKVIVDALSLAGTPASQEALGEIAADRAAPLEARRYALLYVGHQREPAEPAVAAVASLLDEADPSLRQAARLTYGACALALRTRAPERAERIVAALLERLDRATSANDCGDLVSALGNAGHARALPALRALAVGTDARLRARATGALRFIDDPTVQPLLVALLADKRDESVRRAAIEAVRFRDVGPYAAALAEVARHDAAPTVRNAAISLLGDRLTALPTLRSVLEDVRAHDPVADNRALAARYL